MTEKFIRVTSGPSALEIIVLDDPAAGQNFSTILDEGYTYLVMSCTFTLTTSVVVANRQASLDFHLATHPLISAPPQGLQVASEALIYSFYINASVIDLSATSADIIARLPSRLYVPGGVRIGSSVNGIDVGDQISDITLYLQKWPVLVV